MPHCNWSLANVATFLVFILQTVMGACDLVSCTSTNGAISLLYIRYVHFT